MLADFILRAKAASYVGVAERRRSCRFGSTDIGFEDGDWRYLDSYFGGSDFHGQEVVWHLDIPVWAMSYYGHIIEPELITSRETVFVIKSALSTLYKQGRFLGAYQFSLNGDLYSDQNTGTHDRFSGRETIHRHGTLVYQLDYFGGLILP